MKKVLKLRFTGDDGKTNMITINNPKANLEAGVVKSAMQKIVDSNIFEKSGIGLYSKVLGAHYYTTQADDIFNDSVAE